MKARWGQARTILFVSAISVFLTWLCIASFLALLFGGCPFDNNPFDNAVFNRSQWMADESCSDGSNRRGSMAQDIVQHHLKQGMSQQQVVALLGIPADSSRSDFEKYFRNGHFYFSYLSASQYKQADHVSRYLVGEELDMAWGIDHAELDVFFKDGRYVGSRIGWPG